MIFADRKRLSQKLLIKLRLGLLLYNFREQRKERDKIAVTAKKEFTSSENSEISIRRLKRFELTPQREFAPSDELPTRKRRSNVSTPILLR